MRIEIPYVGITGFTKPEQVRQALGYFDLPWGRRLMIGALASPKSLRGEPMREKWAKQTPLLSEVANIFSAAYGRGALRLVHYSADSDGQACRDLLKIVADVGDPIDGFQLNIVWPAPRTLSAFHTLVRDRRRIIVLQIGQAAVERAGGTPDGVAKRLLDYDGLIDYVLFDASGGEGRPLDARSARPYLRAMREVCERRLFSIGLGAAGGLGPDTMGPIEALLPEFPHLSWDAQGRLRNERNELDPSLVVGYRESSRKLLLCA